MKKARWIPITGVLFLFGSIFAQFSSAHREELSTCFRSCTLGKVDCLDTVEVVCTLLKAACLRNGGDHDGCEASSQALRDETLPGCDAAYAECRESCEANIEGG